MTLSKLFLIFLSLEVALLTAQVIDSESQFVHSGFREFTVLGYGHSSFDGIFFERENEGETEKVFLRFRPDRRSQLYRLSLESKQLTFYSETQEPSGRVKRHVRGHVQLERQGSRSLLLFLEGQKFAEDGVFDIQPLDESGQEWGGGCFRFLNLSGSTLHCVLGRFSGPLEKGVSRVVRFPVDQTTPVRLQFAVDVWEKKQIVYSTETLPDPRFGKFFVIKPPADPESLRIKVIPIW